MKITKQLPQKDGRTYIHEEHEIDGKTIEVVYLAEGKIDLEAVLKKHNDNLISQSEMRKQEELLFKQAEAKRDVVLAKLTEQERADVLIYG